MANKRTLRTDEQVHLQDIDRLVEEKASLRKTILWDLRQRFESRLLDTRDIDPVDIQSKRERILIRHLQDIDRILKTEYSAS